MNRIHFISGFALTIFISLHLFNHFISVFGAEAHIELMNILRIVYRNVIVETILLTAVSVQIISGSKLFLSKRKLVKDYFEKLQIWTGLYLGFFIIVHVGAVLIGRHILNLDTNYYFGVMGLNTFPFNLFFIPYYGFAIFSFFGHIAAIHFQKMNKRFLGLEVKQQSNFILITGIVVTVIIMYGLTGGFIGVKIPVEYDIILGK